MCFSLTRPFQLLVIFVAVCLSACSATTMAYKETLELVLFPEDDIDLSLIELQQRQVPALYVRINNTPRAMLGLVSSDDISQRWISQDYGLVVLQHGRLNKLLGFNEQLIGQTTVQQDWLTKPLGLLRQGDQSILISDWSGVKYRGMRSHIEIVAIENMSLRYFDTDLATVRVDEQVEFSTGDVVINSYWFSTVNGMLLKTKQQPLPNWFSFEVEYISDIAKNLSAMGESR